MLRRRGSSKSPEVERVCRYGTIFWSEVLVGIHELVVFTLRCAFDPAFHKEDFQGSKYFLSARSGHDTYSWNAHARSLLGQLYESLSIYIAFACALPLQ